MKKSITAVKPEGFFISGSGHRLSHNIALGNDDAGFYISATNVEMSRNASIGNRLAGIFMGFGDARIERNNLYGNEAGSDNCGLRNFSDATIVATNNYWGAPTGPGPDPADAVCDFGTSITITVPFAIGEWYVLVD